MLSVAETQAEAKTQPIFSGPSSTRRAEIWLDQQVMKAGGRAASQVVELTPELAEVLLNRNPDNRRLKPGKVAEFATDMSHGAWKLNGEPIIVSSDGLLNDGQHRCAAVLQTGVPVMTVIVFGVERESRDTLDQGALRTPGDYLSMHGFTEANHLAATARLVFQWRKYGFIATTGGYFPTRSEIVELTRTTPAIAKSLGFVVNRKHSRAFGSVSMLAFVHFAIRSVTNEMDANFFVESLIEGADLQRGNPILAARNRLITDRSVLRTQQKIELLFRAWNAHREGKTTRLIITGGELPMLEG